MEGLENLPAQGPVILASNHLSYFDPLAYGYVFVLGGRRTRFLAKSELFKNFLLRRVLLGAGQIPVERGTGSTAPLAAAADALVQGQAVAIFPEGTTTRNPDLSMQPSKTGVARLAISTGVAVTPAAIWGTHHIWKSKKTLLPAFGRPVWVKVGEPMDFLGAGAHDDPAVLREVTEQIARSIEALRREVEAGYPERWR